MKWQYQAECGALVLPDAELAASAERAQQAAAAATSAAAAAAATGGAACGAAGASQAACSAQRVANSDAGTADGSSSGGGAGGRTTHGEQQVDQGAVQRWQLCQQELLQRWRKLQRQRHLGQEPAGRMQGAEGQGEDESTARGSLCSWPTLSQVLMLSSLAWHVLDLCL